MGKKDIRSCRTPQDFDSALMTNGAEFVRQNGSHKIYHLKESTFIIAQHPGDVNKFIRKRLIQMMLAAGIGLILLAVFVSMAI